MKNRVLIVDDEEILLDLYEQNLEKFGYLVERAESGNEAIEKLSNMDFNLVLSDIKMPNGDGKDVLNHVRNKLNLEIPVIMLTKYTNGTSKKFMGLGADTILFKPISMDDLMNTIMIYLPSAKDKSA